MKTIEVSQSAWSFREDIQFLRAVAVLAVVLYHAKFIDLAGGYLGVDVFFVISGYLIHGIITNDFVNHKFSLINFYTRRVRRIFPALFVVVFATLPFLWFTLTPDQLKNYFQSIAAVFVFLSNILFFLEGGYFDLDSSLKPLLHTWSLSIEAQFYVLYPLVFLFLFALFKNRIYLFLVASVLLSLFAIWKFQGHGDLLFYIPAFRFWELIVGCIAYEIYRIRDVNYGAFIGAVLSSLGFIFILGSFFLPNGIYLSPGFQPLVAVLGVFLVLINKEDFSSFYLSSLLKPFMTIGAMSYSFYLWHQPLLVIAETYPNKIGLKWDVYSLLAVLISLLLAHLSFRFVENTFRKKNFINDRLFIRFFFFLSFLSVVVGVYGYYKIKMPEVITIGSDIVSIPKAYKGLAYDGNSCMYPLEGERNVCVTSGDIIQGERVSIFLLGDSLARVLSEKVPDHKSYYSSLFDLSSSGCPYLPTLNIYNDGVASRQCTPEYQRRRLEVIRNDDAETKIVILSHRLLTAYLDDKFDNRVGGVSYERGILAASNLGLSDREVRKQVFESLRLAILELSEAADQVVIVTPGYSNGWNPIDRAWRLRRSFNDSDELFSQLQIPYEVVNERANDLVSYLVELAENYKNTFVLDTTNLTCDKVAGVCFGGKKGVFYFTDEVHFSPEVNAIVADEVFNLLHRNVLGMQHSLMEK